MKKNITINLFGATYAIDEDAYELLKKYQDNMRSYFSKKEGGEEIADDIEHRVAELMAELRANGVEAISIEHIEQIINRIGNPEQMNDSEAEKETPDEEDNKKTEERNRRLYRDPQDAMLGGVISGLSHFFGFGDPTFLRLAMVVLFFFSASTILIAYIVLWLIVPKAETAEERLRMKGKPINSATLNEEIISGVKRAKDFVQSEGTKRSARGCLNSLLNFIVGVGKLALIIFAFIILLLLIIGLIVALTFGGIGSVVSFHPFFNGMEEIMVLQSIPYIDWQIGIAIFFLLVAVLLPIFILGKWLFNFKHKSSSPLMRTGLFIFWVTAVVICISMASAIGIQYKNQHRNQFIENLTRNNIYLCPGSWAHIDNGAWELQELKGCREDISQYCTHISNGRQQRYFLFQPKWNTEEGMKVRLCRKQDLPAGKYRLEGLAFADGAGSFCYVNLPGREPLLTEIPVNDKDANGNLSEIDWAASRHISFFSSVKNEAKWDSISHAGRKWNVMLSESFEHPGGEIEFGLVCNPEFTKQPWHGSEIYLLDLVLARTDESKPKKNH